MTARKRPIYYVHCDGLDTVEMCPIIGIDFNLSFAFGKGIYGVVKTLRTVFASPPPTVREIQLRFFITGANSEWTPYTHCSCSIAVDKRTISHKSIENVINHQIDDGMKNVQNETVNFNPTLWTRVRALACACVCMCAIHGLICRSVKIGFVLLILSSLYLHIDASLTSLMRSSRQ